MRTFSKDPEAISKLSPEQYRVTQQSDTEYPRDRGVSAQQGTGHLRRRRIGRAAVRFVRQVRLGLRLAELHPAHRTCQCQRTPGRYGHRGALDARRQPSRPRLPRRAARSRRIALLHQLGRAALHPSRRHGGRGLWGLLEPGGGAPMTTERAVLAGGCFWGAQDLIRRQEGVLSTRVGYTGGTNSHATYRNHPGHAEAVEITFDPGPHQLSAAARVLLPDSRPDDAQSTRQRRRHQLSLGDLLYQRRAEAGRRRHDRRRRRVGPVARQSGHRSGSGR